MKLSELEKLDSQDSLAKYKEEFLLPENTIYLNGNSLGPLTKRSKSRTEETLREQWGNDLIGSWNKHGWIDLPLTVGNKLAPLIGAKQGRVICTDSVSVNLFKVFSAAFHRNPDLRKILSLESNFPTDLYIADGFAELLQYQNITVEKVAESELDHAITSEPAIVLLTQVDFRSGAALDIAAITELAHKHNCVVIWDLSHSIGVMDLKLDNWNVDYAVGCGYKYLNGGPGAPAFIYIGNDNLADAKQALQGWMGHKAPFEFSTNYVANPGINRFQSGTPPILSMAALDAALDLFAELGTQELRKKSLSLSESFLALMDSQETFSELKLASPRNPQLRGAQLSFSHPEAYGICQSLQEKGVYTDFRNPDVLRFGFSPLFLSFVDLYRCSQILAEIMLDKSYKNQKFAYKNKVT